jgi:hypothetical protein
VFREDLMSRILRHTVLVKSEEGRKADEKAKEAERLDMENRKRQEVLEVETEAVQVAQDKYPNSKVLEQYVSVRTRDHLAKRWRRNVKDLLAVLC